MKRRLRNRGGSAETSNRDKFHSATDNLVENMQELENQQKIKAIKKAIKKWKKHVKTHYPDARRRVHFIPPHHFFKVPHTEREFAGQKVLVRQSSCESKDAQRPSCASACAGETTSLDAQSEKPDADSNQQENAKKRSSKKSDSQQSEHVEHTTKSKSAKASKKTKKTGAATAANSKTSKECPKKGVDKPAKKQQKVDQNDCQKSDCQKSDCQKSDCQKKQQPVDQNGCRTSDCKQCGCKRSGCKKSDCQKLLSVLSSDLQDDAAHHWFLKCLKMLGEENIDGENGMMVISHLDFMKYLNCPTDVLTKAEMDLFPQSAQLQDKDCHRGEIDVVIIHPMHGIILVEIKSVGASGYESEEKLVEAIVNKIKKAVKQFKKQTKVVNHLLEKDPVVKVLSGVPVTMTLVLPNLTRQELLKTLQKDKSLAKDLCECLGCNKVTEAVDMCLCGRDDPRSFSDTQPHNAAEGNNVKTPQGSHSQDCRSPWFSPVASLCSRFKGFVSRMTQDQSQGQHGDTKRMRKIDKARVHAWWNKVTARAGSSKKKMTGDLYEQLLARFCGPATTIDVPTARKLRQPVKTVGAAVAQAGFVMSSVTLVPQQLDVLCKDDAETPSVFLYGPPGAGKSVCLMLKGVQWRNQGKTVHVLSAWREGDVMSIHIQEQIRIKTAAADPTKGRQQNKEEQKNPNQAAATRSLPGTLQHFKFNFRDANSLKTAVKLLKKASKGDDSLYIIVDEIAQDGSDQFNEFFAELKAKVPKLHLWAAGIPSPKVRLPDISYEAMTVPLRCPQAVMEEVVQSDHMGDQTVDSITPAYSCLPGPSYTESVKVLWMHHALHPGHALDYPENCEACGSAIIHYLDKLKIDDKESNDLQSKDVLILCSQPSEDMPMVKALSRRFAVQVLDRQSSQKVLEDVAKATSNKITVTDHSMISGLERKVVVGMGRTTSGLLAHNVGRLCDYRLLTVLLGVFLLAFFGEVLAWLMNWEPAGLVLKTVGSFSTVLAVIIITLLFVSKRFLLCGGIIAGVLSIIPTTLVLHFVFGPAVVGLVGFCFLNVLGGFVGCRFACIFAVMMLTVLGYVTCGHYGGIVGGMIACFLYNRHRGQVERIIRGAAFGISYTGGSRGHTSLFATGAEPSSQSIAWTPTAGDWKLSSLWDFFGTVFEACFMTTGTENGYGNSLNWSSIKDTLTTICCFVVESVRDLFIGVVIGSATSVDGASPSSNTSILHIRPAEEVAGSTFVTVGTFTINGFWTGVICSMLGNMVWEIFKGRAGSVWDYIKFLLAFGVGVYLIVSLLSGLPAVVGWVMVGGMVLGMVTGVVVERIQVKKSRDRLHAMSRTTAMLVWIDEPVPRLLCL